MSNQQAVDVLLARHWNEAHKENPIYPEHFWEACRQLSQIGVLNADEGAVSTFEVGPFCVAVTINPSQQDMLSFFLESVFPALIADTQQLAFDDAYPLYILPLIKILIYVLQHSFVIRDELQWRVLMHIKVSNGNNVFPSEEDIVDSFGQCDRDIIKVALRELTRQKSVTGARSEVISVDEFGKYHCLA